METLLGSTALSGRCLLEYDIGREPLEVLFHKDRQDRDQEGEKAMAPTAAMAATRGSPVQYRVYSKLKTHTALGPYSRATPRSIGPP